MFENTKNLGHLALSYNLLFHFDMVGMPKLENLFNLELNFDNLLDFNENVLVDKFPRLRRIGLEGNLFECRNLQSMLGVMRARKIEISTITLLHRVWGLRYAYISQTNDIDCLERELHFKAVVDQITKNKPATCFAKSELIRVVTKEQDNWLITVIS